MKPRIAVKQLPVVILTGREISIDGTVNYIFRDIKSERDLIISRIDKNDGRTILCLPSSIGCVQGCKFCQLNAKKDLESEDKFINAQIVESMHPGLLDAIGIVIDEEKKNRTLRDNLLFSFMREGEPIASGWEDLYWTIIYLMNEWKGSKFALSTSLPKGSIRYFTDLSHSVLASRIPLKIYLSLHFADEVKRSFWMPNALTPKSSIAILESYRNLTGEEIRIHHTLIDEINDSAEDMYQLKDLLYRKSIKVKFLQFTPVGELKPSGKVSEFREYLEKHGIETSFYNPPGRDIGASCGQFYPTLIHGNHSQPCDELAQ